MELRPNRISVKRNQLAGFLQDAAIDESICTMLLTGMPEIDVAGGIS